MFGGNQWRSNVGVEMARGLDRWNRRSDEHGWCEAELVGPPSHASPFNAAAIAGSCMDWRTFRSSRGRRPLELPLQWTTARLTLAIAVWVWRDVDDASGAPLRQTCELKNAPVQTRIACTGAAARHWSATDAPRSRVASARRVTDRLGLRRTVSSPPIPNRSPSRRRGSR